MQHIGSAAASAEVLARSREFIYVAKALLAGGTEIGKAVREAERFGFSDQVVRIVRGGVAGGSTTAATWAQELAAFRLRAQSFLQSVRPFSAFETILGDGSFLTAPLHSQGVSVPTPASAGVVDESAAIPATPPWLTLQLSRLQEQKVACICPFTAEIAQSGSVDATDFIANQLRKKITKAIDVAFLDEITGSPTGIPTISSAGMTGAQFRSDFADALQALSPGADSRVYAICAQNMLSTIGLMCNTSGSLLFPGVGIGGGTATGVRFLPSDAANVSNAIVLVDAGQVVAGTAAGALPLTLSVSTEAALQLDDAPGAGARPLTPLWQTDIAAIRCIRYVGFELTQATGVAVIEGVAATI